MKSSLFSILLFLFLFSLEARAATYYVSASLGNDSWSGSLPEPNISRTDGPKQTLDAAQDLLRNTTVAGDQVLLRRGDVWRAAAPAFSLSNVAGVPDNFIVVGAYGNGAKPVLEMSGSSSIISLRGSNDTPTSYLRFENLRLTTAASPGNRPAGVYINETYRSNDPHHLAFAHLEIEGLRHGMTLYETNIVVEYCTIKNNFGISPESGHTQGIYAHGSNITIRNNLLENNGKADSWFDWNTYLSYGTGYVYENNLVRNALSGLKLRRANNTIVRGNTFHGMNLVGISVGGDDSGGIENVVIEKNLIYDTVDGITVKDQSGGGDVGISNLVIRNNILHSNRREGNFGGGYGAYLFISPHPILNSFVYNNLIYGVQRKRNFSSSNTQAVNLLIKNNIFARTNEEAALVEVEAASLGGLQLDHNCYYFPGGTLIRTAGVNYSSLDVFRSAHAGQEQHGQQGDPRLLNPPSDFHPSRESALLLDRGAEASGVVDDDYDGNTRPMTVHQSSPYRWDIGPFEYDSSNDDTLSPAAPSHLRTGS